MRNKYFMYKLCTLNNGMYRNISITSSASVEKVIWILHTLLKSNKIAINSVQSYPSIASIFV